MSTAWCLSVAFFAPWVVGAPVAWLVHRRRPLRPGDWLWVPFFGLAALVCSLQPLVAFADLPLTRTTPWFWAAVVVACATMLAHRSGRASLRSVPWRVVVFALMVYVGQGAGVVVRGVEHYRGDLQSDQYPYVVLAQFLMDEPFSTDEQALSDRPWLILPLRLKPDRLGQSVVHGFFAATTGHDALDLFFPTLLLGPGLMVPAVFLLGTQCALPRRWTTWVALAAGLAPGAEVLVSFCYLSHVLGDSAFVAFLAGVIRLTRGGGWRPLAGTVASFVLGFSVYTEFTPLFLGAAGVALIAGLLRRHIGARRAAGMLAALVLALVLNPSATDGARSVWGRGTNAGAQMTTGHRTGVWVATVWLHFEKVNAMKPAPARTFSHAVLYGSEAATVLGGIVFFVRTVRSRRRLLPTLACAALLLPPLALWVIRPESAYVIGKLVLTLTPVLVLFIACGAFTVERLAPRWGRRVISILAIGFLAILAMQSGLEQWTWLRHGQDVGPARLWNDPDLQHLCIALREQETTDVVIALTGDGGWPIPAVASGALCYYARHHRIRLASPQRMWTVDLAEYPTVPRTTVENLRAGTLLVVRRGTPPAPGQAREIVFENDTFQLVRIVESPRA